MMMFCDFHVHMCTICENCILRIHYITNFKNAMCANYNV